MKLVYLTSAHGHISTPLSDYFSRIYGKDFAFVVTNELAESRKAIGSGDSGRDYIVDANKNKEYAKKLCDEAEILIFGAAPLEYIENRIKENKLTIYYSERLFKRGYYRYFNPITFSRVRKRFVLPSRNSNFHLLCASSFAALDFSRIGAFQGKMYKWGYQPAIYQKDINALLADKAADGLDFIWVGRLVALKHCDDAIRVVARLKKEGYNPRMTVIGTGEEENALKNLAKALGVGENILFKGACVVDETRRLMDKANIFMFTSDFGEGWGVTLNECMNSGVACVASHGAGATNFLLDDGKNGLIYRSGDIDGLFARVKQLVHDRQLREDISRHAYDSIYHKWNVDFSGQRMLEFFEQLKTKGECDLFEDGPLSRALPLSHNWYKK